MSDENPDACVRTAALTRLLEWLSSEGYSFRTITPASHARVNARSGAEVAHSLRDVFGWSRPFGPGLLPGQVLGWLRDGGLLRSGSDLQLQDEEGLHGEALLRSAVRVSTLDGTLFAHSAYPTHEADAVFFGPDTYRFAELIGAQLERLPLPPGGRILDLGCGSGAGGIVAARQSAAAGPHTWLSDINAQALPFARANAAHAGCPVQCRASDLYAALEGEFDLVLANPPYLNDAQARTYRHGGGRWGEALSVRIVRETLPRLQPGGRLVLYTAAAIVDGVDPLHQQLQPMQPHGWPWRYWELDPDVFGEELERPAYREVERIAVVALVVQRPPNS